MHTIILNGMTPEDPLTEPLCDELFAALEARAWPAENLALAEMNIKPCLGCFKCWIDRPGECFLEGEHRDVARKVVQSDLAVLLTPITFGGYSYHLKKVMDHLIPNIAPFFKPAHGETHHWKRYPAFPRLLALGIEKQADPEAETVFRSLVERNQRNMSPPVWAAGILTADQSSAARRETIAGWLAQMEVAS